MSPAGVAAGHTGRMHPCAADDDRATPSVLAGSVGAAMVTVMATASAEVTVGEVRRSFADDHVHAVVIVRDGLLLAVVERDDLRSADGADAAPARPLGRLGGRTVTADLPLAEARRRLDATGGRRLAVVDDRGRLVGLLCLKRSRLGFCSDRDVLDRARERAGRGDPQPA